MYFDLNVPVPIPASLASSSNAGNQSKKGKGKAQQQQPSQAASAVVYSPAQITALEARIDLLIHLGYTVIALTQTVHKKVEPKTFVNTLDALLGSGNERNKGGGQLKTREGIIFLKRLTITLDEDSEKGFGLTNANASLFAPYDLIALQPTTEASLSSACLTHTLPSPLTAHIISIPLTLPRLPFRLKHTVVRTALRNGAVFEICYAGALGSEADQTFDLGSTGGEAAKRNWWAAAREAVRVTKGKSGNLIISSGVANEADLRAPRDIGNLATFVGLAQNDAHDAATKAPKSIVLRAQTRKTYRAVFSEPEVVIPPPIQSQPNDMSGTSALTEEPAASVPQPQVGGTTPSSGNGKKRLRDDIEEAEGPSNGPNSAAQGPSAKKKKKGKRNEKAVAEDQ